MSDTYLPGDTRQRIQDLIKNRKITQAELAERVGLSNSALSRYLQESTKSLGDGFIIRIAKYFDVSTDFLLGETDIPDRKKVAVIPLLVFCIPLSSIRLGIGTAPGVTPPFLLRRSNVRLLHRSDLFSPQCKNSSLCFKGAHAAVLLPSFG